MKRLTVLTVAIKRGQIFGGKFMDKNKRRILYGLLVFYIEILTAFRIGFDVDPSMYNMSYGWAGYGPHLTSTGHMVSIGATIIIVALLLVPIIYLTIMIRTSKQGKGEIFIIWVCVILGIIIAVLLNLAGISVIGRMACSLFEFINNGKELYYIDWSM